MQKLPIRISTERWKQAQEWELNLWRSQNRTKLFTWQELLKQLLRRTKSEHSDDWNFWWSEKFAGYQVLPKNLENAIELGCGPYTNMRLILQGRCIEHVYCSDPLLKHYITFSGKWLAEAWKRGDVLIDDHPLEECPFASDYFCLVVLINVLDHVKDSILCLRQAIRITKPGGYLIVGQDLSNMEDVLQTGDDIGHPIRIDRSTLDLELMPHFETVLYKTLGREEGRNPSAHYGTYIFIGRKRIRTSISTLSCKCSDSKNEGTPPP